MRKFTGLAAGLALTGLLSTGCMKDESGGATMKKGSAMPAATQPSAAAAAAPAMSDKDMTHECTAEAPMFTAMPVAEGVKPAMMLKPGDKVLVMVPRGKYAQVTTVGGVKGYVPTAALKPIGGH